MKTIRSQLKKNVQNSKKPYTKYNRKSLEKYRKSRKKEEETKTVKIQKSIKIPFENLKSLEKYRKIQEKKIGRHFFSPKFIEQKQYNFCGIFVYI